MSQKIRPKTEVSRRAFVGGAATVFAAATLAAPRVFACADHAHLSMPLAQDEPPPELTPKLKAEVDAKLQHIFARWGDRLNDEQRKRMRTIVSEHVKMLDAVRQVKISNGDSPASVLKLMRGKAKS